jgi:hypothetical protein
MIMRKVIFFAGAAIIAGVAMVAAPPVLAQGTP